MQAALQSFVYILIQILSLHRLTFSLVEGRNLTDLHIIGQILANFNIFQVFQIARQNRPRYW